MLGGLVGLSIGPRPDAAAASGAEGGAPAGKGHRPARAARRQEVLSSVTTYTYDARDRLTKVVGPSPYVTTTVYDAQGRVVGGAG